MPGMSPNDFRKISQQESKIFNSLVNWPCMDRHTGLNLEVTPPTVGHLKIICPFTIFQLTLAKVKERGTCIWYFGPKLLWYYVCKEKLFSDNVWRPRSYSNDRLRLWHRTEMRKWHIAELRKAISAGSFRNIIMYLRHILPTMWHNDCNFWY